MLPHSPAMSVATSVVDVIVTVVYRVLFQRGVPLNGFVVEQCQTLNT